MEGLSYHLQTAETVPDTGLLFGLAPRPGRMPSFALIGGSLGVLTGFNWLVELLQSLRMPVQLWVPEATEKALPWLSARTLPTGSGMDAQRLDNELSQQRAVIVGPGLQLSSDVQIVLDAWLTAAETSTIVTDEVLGLYKTNIDLLDNANLMPFVSLPTLAKLLRYSQTGVKLQPNRGIFNIGSLLAALPTQTDLVMVYDNERLYSYWRPADLVVHTALPASLSVDELRGAWLASLALTWFSAPNRASAELLQTAHYVFAHLSAGLTPGQTAQALLAALEATE